MTMKWAGVNPQQYDQVRELVKWEEDKPQGGMFHIAYFDNEGLRVTDVWKTKEDFDNFVNNRLMPGVKQLGIEGQPEVEIHPAHAVFAPGYQEL